MAPCLRQSAPVAHKAEHVVDLEIGAIVAITLQEVDQGNTTTIQTTLPDLYYGLLEGLPISPEALDIF